MADMHTATWPDANWPKTLLRIGFGVIWLIDAILKWLPGFRSGYMDTLMGQAQGQPGWLKPWFDFWINLQHPQPTFIAYLVAVIETLIVLALVAGLARKLTYSAAIVFSLLIWGTPKGSAAPIQVAPPTSVPQSSTPWCSPGCCCSPTTMGHPS